jgi:murein L,D-transpeptidase YafK
MANIPKLENRPQNSRRRAALKRLAGFLLPVAVAVACYLVLRPSPEPTEMRIEIYKAARELAYHDGHGQKRMFRAALGSNPTAQKRVEGDGATPIGRYFICCKNPQSNFLLSLGISYPGPRDADRGLAAGLISPTEHAAILQAHAEGRTPPWKTALGGEIFIHGRGSQSDWTAGCVALDDPEMRELYDLIAVGTPVIIHP